LISLIIPAYNEEKRIERAAWLALNVADQVIVVADGYDKTADVVKTLDDKRIELVVSKYRLGKGGAFLKGFEAAAGDQIFLVDADFPVEISYVPHFSELLNSYDIVIASRYSRNSLIVGEPFLRRILSLGFRLICKILFHQPIEDFQCGFKAFRREALDVISPQMHIKGFAFDVELLLRAIRQDFKIVQVPVIWKYGKGSKVKWRQILEMAKELWQLHQYLLK